MASRLDRKAERGVYLGPDIIVVDREPGERGRDIEQGKGVRGRAQIVAGFKRLGAEPLKNLELEIERALAGIGDLGLGLAEL